MQQYEKVSINPTGSKKLSDIMNPQTSNIKQEMKPQMSSLGKLMSTKDSKKTSSKHKSLTKQQIHTLMKNTTAATTVEKKYSSKENKLNLKEDKVMRILNYQNSSRFGASIRKELKFNYTRDQLMKKTLDQIDNVLYRIRNYLNNRGMNGIYEQMVKTTAIGYENIVSEFYDIEGFSDMLMQNPAFWDAFERWKIERTLPDIPPSLQLAYIIGTTTMLAHMKKTSLATDTKLKREQPNSEKQENKETKTKLSFGTKLS